LFKIDLISLTTLPALKRWKGGLDYFTTSIKIQEVFTTRIKAVKKEKYLKSGVGHKFIKTLLNSQSNWPRGALRFQRDRLNSASDLPCR
jgi:hypothetical protein